MDKTNFALLGIFGIAVLIIASIFLLFSNVNITNGDKQLAGEEKSSNAEDSSESEKDDTDAPSLSPGVKALLGRDLESENVLTRNQRQLPTN